MTADAGEDVEKEEHSSIVLIDSRSFSCPRFCPRDAPLSPPILVLSPSVLLTLDLSCYSP